MGTAPPMGIFSSRYYPVGGSDGSLFGVVDSDGKVGVGPRTTHINFQKISFLIYGVDFVSYQSSYYSSKIHS